MAADQFLLRMIVLRSYMVLIKVRKDFERAHSDLSSPCTLLCFFLFFFCTNGPPGRGLYSLGSDPSTSSVLK